MIPADLQRDYILEDEVALLRPLTRDDYDHLVPFSLHEPGLWRYSLFPADSPEKMKAYIQEAIEGRTQQTSYPFIVFDKRTQRFAGSTRFYDIQPDHHMLQLGYTWYGRDFQGTGLNKHCKFLLLSLAFDDWGMERVEFRADQENERSIRAMKSIGCRVEGILRSHATKPDGSRRSSIVLSILKNEWDEEIKSALRNQLK